MTDGTDVTDERPVARINAVLELLILLAVLGLAFVVWQADQHARDTDKTLLCIQRAQAIATVGLMTPADSIDKDGRLQAVQVLSNTIDRC